MKASINFGLRGYSIQRDAIGRVLQVAQKMAADSSAPEEIRELGRVVQRIMIGDKNVDFSSLPREWAEAVKKELGG